MDRNLPELISLIDFNGNYASFIDAVYKVFEKDFVASKPVFRNKKLALKHHPEYQGKAYTFYHMTHKGKDENNRTPDIRRCERIPFAKPVIEKCDNWSLKVWPQKRGNKTRICIWLDFKDDLDYFVILDVRPNYILPWTAFVAEYQHEKDKKMKEYTAYLKKQKPPDNFLTAS